MAEKKADILESLKEQLRKKQAVLIFARDTLVAIGREESKKIMVGVADK